MANNITPEMIALLNSGNKAELRAFLKLYTRPVYERALAITKSEEDAIRVTRRVTSEVSVLALRGKLEEDIDAQLMALTDACCSEDMFFARLVEDTLRDYPEEKNEQPTLFGKAVKPNWPAKQPSVVERGSAAITASAPKSKTDGEPVTAAASAYTAPAAESSTPRLFDEDLSLDWEDEDDIEPEDEADSKPSVLIVLLIFLLAIVTLALVWVLVVKLMRSGSTRICSGCIRPRGRAVYIHYYETEVVQMDFMSAYLAGWSVLSLMCLIIGLGLMIAEMFTPGLGLMGTFGIIALIAAIVLSAHSLLDAIFTLAIIFVVLFIAGFIVYRSFTKGRLANSSIVLSDRIDSASTSLDDAEIQGIVGKEGITTTALRPSGNAEIDGKRYDVVTSGEFIQKDTRITVKRIDGLKILVKRAEDAKE